jgi:hypothetical protein
VTVLDNRIGGEGATAVAGAIKGLTAMATLDLRGMRGGWGELE